MERDRQGKRFNHPLDLHGIHRGRNGFHGHERHRMNVENAVVMVRLLGSAIVIAVHIAAVMVMAWLAIVMIGDEVVCHGMNSSNGDRIDLVRVRGLGDGGAGPDKRSGQDDHQNATHEGHLPYTDLQLFRGRECPSDCL